MGGRNIGVVLVHGIGRQERYQTLKEFTSSFHRSLRGLLVERGAPSPQLHIDKVELNRKGTRTEETSDLYSFFGDAFSASPAARQYLFRPITICCDQDRIHFYEAYWADEDLTFNLWEKLKFNVWLLTTMWNPLFNKLTGKYRRPRLGTFQLLFGWLWVFLLSFAYHLAEIFITLASFAFRRTEPIRRWGELIYEYAGDVKLYAEQKELYFEQTKKDIILTRFDETLIKAHLDNDELHIVGSSLGSVIAYDGLSRHPIRPSKMSSDFLLYLERDAPRAQEKKSQIGPIDPQAKIRSLITLGSPLDKFYFFWPKQRQPKLQPSFLLVSSKESTPERPRWSARETSPIEKPSADWKWFNVTDAIDPIGSKLDFFDLGSEFPNPQNQRLAAGWLPSSAHLRYFERPEVMRWLVTTVYPRAGDCSLPSDSGWSFHFRFLTRVGWALGLGGISILLWLQVGFLYLLKFLLGFGHDLYMDAESHTIFSELELVDALVVGFRETLALDSGDPVRVLQRLLIFLAAGLFLSAPISLFYFHRSERRRGVRELALLRRLRASRQRAS